MLRLLPDLRYLGAGTLLNSIGMMGELVVLGWLALELTDSPFLVGAAMGARALPLFFVGVPAGVIADRLPRQRLLIATGAGQAVATALMGVLALTGTVSLAQLVLLTFVGGVLSGLAILGVAMRAGWLVGSLGAGAVIARYGSGHAYLFVALAYLAGGLAMLPARAVTAATPSTPDSMWQGITGFVDAVNRDRMLLVLMMLTAGAEVLGFAHQALLPSLARDVLHTGPEGLGALNAARSVGGILALLASLRGFTAGSGALFVAVLVSFGGSLIALGVAPHVVGFAGVALLVLLANAAGALADLLAQSLLQLRVPAHLRGRAGGAWVVAIGLAPLGQIQIGALASLFGVSMALGASGLGLVALAGATALLYPRLRAL
jgi:transmembrane secretion effector